MTRFISRACVLGAAAFGTLSNAFDTASVPSLEARQTSNSTNASATFFYTPKWLKDNDVNFTFSLTAVRETGDLFFRLSVPDEWSWVAVGTGSGMKGSLMFVTYKNDKDLVLSPRIATGHVEPSFNSDINLTSIAPPSGDPHPSGIHDDTWFVSGHCQNCTGPGHGAKAIDLNSTSQPFIFAFGPSGKYPDSGSKSAPLRRHTAYGHFTMDMRKATVTTTDGAALSRINVPALGTSMNGASLDGDVKNDRGHSSRTHALLMCFAFLVAFPLGVVAARIFGKINFHSTFQGVGMVIVILGMGVGLYAGKYYNRSKHVTNGHQIFGLIIVALIIVQYSIGFVHHRHYVKTQTPLKNGLFIKIHRILGPLAMAAGIINGAFGFRFAQTRWNIVYVPLVLVVVIILLASTGIQFFLRRKRGPKTAAPQPYGAVPPAYPGGPAPPYGGGPAPPYAGVGSYQPPPPSQPYNDGGWGTSSRSDIALTSMEPERPKQMV